MIIKIKNTLENVYSFKQGDDYIQFTSVWRSILTITSCSAVGTFGSRGNTNKIRVNKPATRMSPIPAYLKT